MVKIIAHRELLEEWDYTANGQIGPEKYSYGSHKIVGWICKEKGHKYLMEVRKRAMRGYGCPYCSGHRVLVGENDLRTNYPLLASEWHPDLNNGLSAENVTVHSNKYVIWQCHENAKHVWCATVSNRTRGRGCPYCSGKRVLKGENDFLTIFPSIAEEWDYEKNERNPDEYTAYSGICVWWRCKQCEQVWKASIKNRSRGTGCPYCTGKKPIKGINDLATISPDLASEWHPIFNKDLSPEDVFPQSNKQVFWRCLKSGHVYKGAIYSRYAGEGCPYCSGRRVCAGENDLETKRPEIAKEWDYERNKYSPSMIAYRSNKKMWWICANNPSHRWRASVDHRSNGTGCPYCN